MIRFTNSLTRTVEDFVPQGDVVTMYVCVGMNAVKVLADGVAPETQCTVNVMFGLTTFTNTLELLPGIVRL